MTRLRGAPLVLCVATLAACGLARAVWAHGGTPFDLTSWGGFEPGTVQCQRALGIATERCFERVFAAARHCLDVQIAGGSCDRTARDRRIAAAQESAQNQITAACTATQLQQLRFVSLEDATSDVVRACTDETDAVVSLVYGHALATGSVASVDPPTGDCATATAAFAAKLFHRTLRLGRRALDRMAAHTFSLSQKQAITNRLSARLASAEGKIASLVEQACPAFGSTYARSLPSFMNLLASRAACVLSGGYVQTVLACPPPVCGNGVKEPGEQCDDGNTVDDDLCHTDCTTNDCQVFPSTYALIQAAIFENRGCTTSGCHGDFAQRGLDLRSDVSYDNLVGVPSVIRPDLKRVEVGDASRSVLWLKLALATLHTNRTDIGSPMPLGRPALSANELEAVRLWIHAAAPRTGIVAGVAPLLNACAVPPDPIQIQAPDPPAPGSGLQLHMPKWVLEPQSEHEVCFASYYDVSGQVPDAFRGPNGTFRFHRQEILQDPQSHHLIVNLYTGASSIDDPVWGVFTCKGGVHDGQPCAPRQVDSCGPDGVCGSEPTPSVACIGFGPADSRTTGFNGFTGTQQTSYAQTFADGVYQEVPRTGILIWNSHAFNLTDTPAKQEAWLNFYFASPADQRYPVRGIFDASHIFSMNVPPFASQEVCATHVLEQGTRLFQLSSHNHKRGKRFTIFDPDGALIFTSTIYNDPLQLTLDPPVAFDDPDDNGATDPSEVKRKSTSPPPPNGFPLGGPCATPVGCTAGRVGQLCTRTPGATPQQLDQSCDSQPGRGDGRCDACPLTGGVTTEDEMFILLGAYYKIP